MKATLRLTILFVIHQHQVWSFAPQTRHAVSSTLCSTDTGVETTNRFDTYDAQDPAQGLVMKDTLIGTGHEAQKGDVVTVAYEGRLMSTGTKFDEGIGFSFPLGEGKVIPGWDQGLVGMKVGGKRSLRIPPSLAFGERGARDKRDVGGDVIPPNAHLEFDCELKSIASNPFEATLAQINMSRERMAGFAILTAFLALSPFLPQ